MHCIVDLFYYCAVSTHFYISILYPDGHCNLGHFHKNLSPGNFTLCPNKNVTTLFLYNSDIQELILIVFGTNVTEKVGNQRVLYFPTSPN